MKKGNDRGFMLSICAIAALLLLAIAAPRIAPHDPEKAQPELRLKDPCEEYPMGTDHLGRCIFSRVIFGIRISLFRSGEEPWRFGSLHHDPAYPAKYSSVHPGYGHIERRLCHFGCCLFELSRPWRSAAYTRMGIDDE